MLCLNETMSRNVYKFEMLWETADTWKAVNRDLKYLIRRHGSRLSRAVDLAQEIQRGLALFYPLLDELCEVTCPWCPEPCCLEASVCFDFKDLLFCHLGGRQIPCAQPLSDFMETCRYWSHRGCSLPRITRPWVCTWYLCPTQKANLRRKTPSLQDEFDRRVQAIKIGRKSMEAEFIRIVS